ncbi:hypothetical protein LguiB_030262 [Lonicera macranthoides]
MWASQASLLWVDPVRPIGKTPEEHKALERVLEWSSVVGGKSESSGHQSIKEKKRMDSSRELESKHLSCFPNLGEIRVKGLMVKRRSYLYHLSESFPLKYAFPDSTRAYFFYIETCHWSSSENLGLSEHVAGKVRDQISRDSNVTKCKRKKRRFKGFHGLQTVLHKVLRAVRPSKKRKKRKSSLEKNCIQNYPVKGLEKVHLVRNNEERFGLFANRTESEQGQDWNFSPLDKTPSDTLSESVSVSVSGIIKKYFSNSDGVTSSPEVNFAGIRTWPEEQLKVRKENNCSGPQINTPPECTATTPPEMINFALPSYSSSKTSTRVGKRLLIASNNLRISGSKQNPTFSLCRFSKGKLQVPKSSFVRSLVFEISDEDD